MLVKKLGLEVKKEVEEKDGRTLQSCERLTGNSRHLGDRQLLPLLNDLKADTITLEDIFTLHKGVLGRHVAAGVLRTYVSVGDVFDPMDWDEVPGEMDKFLAWLNAELRSGLMSSAELAARASHKFVFNLLMERRGLDPIHQLLSKNTA
uniref:Fido domain-containing protein n=1 Tax=Globodera pallida TaxID=36090 RepID=A0A183C2Z4_GLOPA